MITIKLKPNDHFERAITKLKREEAARQRVKDLHKDIRAALKDEENFLQ
jgi:ribosomal protein S21